MTILKFECIILPLHYAARSGGVKGLMTVDFLPLLSEEKKEIFFDYTSADIAEDSGVFQSGEARVWGKAHNHGGYIRLELFADIPYVTQCARCAKELSRNANIRYETGVTAEEISDDNLDYEVLCDGKLDVDDIVRRSFILELPMTELCSENCLGLCSKCGKDLNEGPCECKAQVDPRLQKIIDAINKSKK